MTSSLRHTGRFPTRPYLLYFFLLKYKPSHPSSAPILLFSVRFSPCIYVSNFLISQFSPLQPVASLSSARMSANNITIDLTEEESVASAAPAPAAAPVVRSEQSPSAHVLRKRSSPLRLVRIHPYASAAAQAATQAQEQDQIPPSGQVLAPKAQVQVQDMEVEEKTVLERFPLGTSPPASQEIEPFTPSSPSSGHGPVEHGHGPAAEPASPPIRAHLGELDLAAAAAADDDEYGHCGSACSGRVVALIGNSNIAKATLVNAWLGLGLLNPRSWFKCNYTFVHDEACADNSSVVREQIHANGTFRTLRFAGVAELAAYLHNKDLGDPAFNIRVHLRFSSNTPAAAATAVQAQAQDPVQVNGVIFFHSMHSSAHTMARLLSHANAIVWCNEAPLCIGDVLELSRAVARCRPDLFCKCVVYQNDNCGGPIPNRHIGYSRVRPLTFCPFNLRLMYAGQHCQAHAARLADFWRAPWRGPALEPLLGHVQGRQ